MEKHKPSVLKFRPQVAHLTVLTDTGEDRHMKAKTMTALCRTRRGKPGATQEWEEARKESLLEVLEE